MYEQALIGPLVAQRPRAGIAFAPLDLGRYPARHRQYFGVQVDCRATRRTRLIFRVVLPLAA